MRKLLIITLGVVILASIAFALRDLTCYEIVEPSQYYVEHGDSIVPVLGVANLGPQAEVEFLVIFRSIRVEDGETAFEDSVYVENIGPGDSIEVEFSEWVPESKCEEDEPWIEHDVYGIVEFGYDENPDNDTSYRLVTCLWSHDVGVYDITHEPGFDEPPDIYHPGTEVIFTAHVENYGFHKEYDVVVSCEILDRTADPDTIAYQNSQYLDSLDWRGNSDGQPYTDTVGFPRLIAPSENWFVVECRTEMYGDQCPDNDFETPHVHGPDTNSVKENHTSVILSLSVSGNPFPISFTIPTAQQVLLSVYDVNGCRVQTLVNDPYPAGTHEITWMTDKYAAGVYFVRFEAGDYRVSEKAIILK